VKPYALTLAVVTSAALADGVVLFEPGAPLQPAEAASVARFAPSIKYIQPVIVDPRAIEATIINVPLGGKTYRFVGAKRELPPSTITGPSDPTDPSKPPLVTYEPGGVMWQGSTPEGDLASIGRSKYGISGEFFAGGKKYMILRHSGRTAVVEIDPTLTRRAASYDQPTQAMIDAARKRAEAREVVK